MNEVPDRSNVIVHLLGERQGFSHQSRDSLAQGAVESFNPIGQTTLLANCPMPLTGENCCIRCPEVGIADGTLSVDWRQGLPQGFSSRF